MPDSRAQPLPALARTSIALLAVLLPAACAMVPEREPDRVAVEQPLDPGGVVEHGVDNEAIARLWAQAEQARAGGETDRAIQAIERAVDVDPEDPVLWSRLAELRLHAGAAAAAEDLAARSNALAPGHRLLRYRNWLIIEAARRAQGDEAGADAARARLERLRAGP